VPRIHTEMHDTSIGHRYWLNGGNDPYATNSNLLALEGWEGASIAYYAPLAVYYQGDVAEFIFYTRALKDEERQSIENYLSQKYKIAISELSPS
jgi:hypothetical protein